MSIYASLFRYRPRLNRQPLEDFLSAALADLLNRLPRNEHVAFISDVLLAGPNCEAGRRAWSAFTGTKPDAELKWVTQRRIRHDAFGILDMLLLVDGREAIVVENKIAAPVRPHGSTTQSAELEPHGVAKPPVVADANQLRTYGKWLAKQCAQERWPGALVLLTHFSVAPADFGVTSYGVPYADVCKWRRVWEWACRSPPEETKLPVSADKSHWNVLRLELASFLEGENMSSELMTSHDLAAVEVFVGAADRITNTFKHIGDIIQPFREKFGGNRNGNFYNGKEAIVWDWLYLKSPKNAKWYFGWGFRFPAISRWWNELEVPLPEVPHAFLVFRSDNREIPTGLSEEALPAGWRQNVSDRHLFVAKPLHEFKADPEGLATNVGEWVLGRMNEIQPYVAKLAEQLSSK